MRRTLGGLVGFRSPQIEGEEEIAPRSEPAELDHQQAPAYTGHELELMTLREGWLYAAGGVVFFTDQDVFDAAKILAEHGIECSNLESRAEIISRARNEHPSSFPDDDLAGYYEDFPG